MKYRAEIDGLRALAVVPVILFHAGFELFSGGFVGVDVFFVISGFLITTILIEDIENQRFSLVNFYERRARRILPALFFVMFVCIPFAWMWMIPSQMEDFSQSLVAVSLFASNVLFWRESGYFDSAAEEKPLLHTWSLAVEEQYYVLFPIFLFLAWRFGKNRVFWMIVVMAVFSLLLSEWGWRNKANANFYLAPTRAWELLAGSIAAFIVQKQGVRRNNYLAFLGLAAIIFSIFAYDESILFPSVYALVPVLGVVLLVLYADKETMAAKILSTKLFVGIGLISYSAYLLHQPLFAFARLRLFEHPSLAVMTMLSTASLVLAYISWRFIEKPFRNRILISKRFIFIISLSGLTLFVSVGLIGHFKKGLPNRLPSQITTALKPLDFERDNESLRLEGNGCMVSSPIPKQPISECGVNQQDNKSEILLIGDSHLDAIGRQLLDKFEVSNLSAYALAYPGCVPISGLGRTDTDSEQQCADYNNVVRNYAHTHGVNTIILVARFPLYLLGDRYNNGEGGVEKGNFSPVDLIENLSTQSDDETERIGRVAERFRADIENLTRDFNVIVFSPTPEVGWDVPAYFSKMVLFSVDSEMDDITISHSYINYLERTRMFRDIVLSIKSENLHIYDMHKLFCDEESNRCLANFGENLLYRDDDHLTPYAANIVAEDFIVFFQGLKGNRIPE
ncbi:acyltransferase [Amylibacter sp.]|nr:acyltransferase [Amylibacter sp.]